MAHFAKLGINNTVEEVIVVNNESLNNLEFPESESVGIDFLKSLYGNETNWKQTSYNAKFRKNFAGINGIYDEIIDAFVHSKPYNSWLLNTNTATWEPPVPKPQDGKKYIWDESVINWIEVQNGS